MRKLRIATLPIAVGALAAIPVALALAASPAPPSVATSPATGVSTNGATLHGSVNPNGEQTSYAFQWGPSNGYGHETSLVSAGAGTSAEAVDASLAGLSPGSNYHFRIIAMSSVGTSVGSDQTFTTSGSPPPPSPSPDADTGPATGVGQAGATVSGTVNPRGQSTQYYFEYGPTANYGLQTPARDAGSGAAPEGATATLTGLSSGTTYHYRVVAVSAGGTALGGDQTFTTTTPPSAVTGGPSKIRTSSAVLNGTTNPNGRQTTYYFQYGPTTAYVRQTTPAGAGSGTSNVAVHAFIGDLTPNSTYHYRLVASSAGGTSYGADRTVTVGRVSHVAFLGREGFVSPGRVIGVEAGCFGGATRCTGHVTLSHNGVVIGQRDFSIAPDSGGFQNMQISRQGEQLLRTYNRVFHLLPVTVSVTASDGEKISQVMHLARWVWR